MRWTASLDMYRKVPADLLEGSKRGSIVSSMALLTIVVLFLLETKAFLNSSFKTHLTLDDNKDPRIRLNFNITMMDLRCDFAVVDVVSVLGTDQNVTAHVSKWQIDGEGVRKRFQGRNRQQHDILLKDDKVMESLEELHANGEDAISLNPTTFGFALQENDYLFVDFYASWCSHCMDLAPTWETLGEVMTAAAESILDAGDHDYSDEEYEHAKHLERPVLIAKVDCVTHHALCLDQGIRAYPTLRLFVKGQNNGDYRGHRTVVELTDWLQKMELEDKKDTDQEQTVHHAVQAANDRMRTNEDKEAVEDDKDRKVMHRRMRAPIWNDEEHPGCQLVGHLMLDRVPGNFHIQARSNHHDLVPHMTNVSHVIHHLSIGEPVVQRLIDMGDASVPSEVKNRLSPMNGNVYVTHELHTAYHHYLKVITTNVDGLSTRRRNLKAYQIVQNSQLSYYRSDVVPEAKFMYDLSPVSVSYLKTSRRWYDYLTSVLAIVGGTFTVVGMMESGMHAAVSRKRRL